jgi:CheY-like chemotaxis protein
MNAIPEEERSIVVLLVEDNPGDVRLAQEAFRDVNRSIRLHLASDGMEAMAFLTRQGNHGKATTSRPRGRTLSCWTLTFPR